MKTFRVYYIERNGRKKKKVRTTFDCETKEEVKKLCLEKFKTEATNIFQEGFTPNEKKETKFKEAKADQEAETDPKFTQEETVEE